jgi:hypothetical protein
LNAGTMGQPVGSSVDRIEGFMIDIAPRDTLGFVISIAAATLLAVVLYRRTSPTVPLRLRIILGVLRWLAAVIVLLLVTDPVAHVVRTRYRKPALAVLVDDSRSMAYPQAETKIDKVKQALSSDFIDRLESRADLRFYAFSERATEITLEEMNALEPTGSRTDLAQGIRTVLDEFTAPPSGFIVVSDGSVNFGEDVVNMASTLRSPVHVLAVTQDTSTADISLDRIVVTETAYANTEVPVSVLVSARHTGPVEVNLSIKDSTGTVFSRQLILAGTGAKTKVDARIDAGEIGTHSFAVEIDSLPTEPVTSNNVGVFALDVVKGKIRVVLVASRPSWDFAFAKRSLEADPNIEVFSVFTGAASARPKIEGTVSGLDALPDVDVVVVLGGGPTEPMASELREWVRGGVGLVVLPGPGPTDLDDDLNPFMKISDEARAGTCVSVAATDIGTAHDILRLSQAASGFLWSELPPVPVSAGVGKAKAEATVLLSGTRDRMEVPVLAIMRYGEGRIVGLSVYDLWRWDLVPKGFGLEASPFSQILINSIGWLTERDEVRRLSVSTSKKTYLWGEPVDVFARTVNENLRPLDGARLEGDVTDQATGTILSHFSMADKGGGSHLAKIDFLDPGSYRVRVSAHLGAETYARETLDLTVDRRGLEDFEYDGDPALLSRVSRLTGGNYYDITDAGMLAAEIKPGMVIVKNFRELRLRLSLPVFLILAGLLSLEWLLRKRRMLL